MIYNFSKRTPKQKLAIPSLNKEPKENISKPATC